MSDFDKNYFFYQDIFEKFLNQEISKNESSFDAYYLTQLNQLSFLSSQLGSFDLGISKTYSEKIKNFYHSIRYSLLSGGKRFRPILCLATADLFETCDRTNNNHEKVLPLALAIEMLHTYSLIHDDLPCMDNDDLRRGKPTNHKVYGESTALLAGDALLTEAFRFLATHAANTENSLKVISLITECAGTLGMIGGQYVDLSSQKAKVSPEELAQVQINKTGALIRASIVGSAILCDADSARIAVLEEFSRYLGLGFQIADDILDQSENELGSFVGIVGIERSKNILESLTLKSLEALQNLEKVSENKSACAFLKDLAQFNSRRLK